MSLRAMTRRAMPLAMLWALTGCSSDEPRDPPPPTYLSPTAHLTRASMALRGVKPSVDDLVTVATDPSALEGIVDRYLASPEFGKVVRDLHNEALLPRVDYFYYPAGFQPLGALADADIYSINRSLEESALRLIEHVVTNDRPYSEIVTADYLLANGEVAAVWGSLDVQGADWQVTHWTDDRPRAGILSDPWLFTRYQSTPSNKGRGRANAVSKALLCYDFLSRDVEIDSSINLADPAVVDDAVVKNAACASCHQTLDPLASFFQDYFPIVVPAQLTDYPFSKNFPIDGAPGKFLDFYYKGLGSFYYTDMRPPGYFGQSADTIADLGARIAEDPRFSRCAAQHAYTYFNEVDARDADFDRIAELQARFISSGMNFKALAKDVVLADDFRLSHANDPDEAATLVGIKKVRPDQLDSMIADLTGFRWEVDAAVGVGQANLLADSFVGFQVLGGGIDSAFVTRPAHTFNGTSSLLSEALAEEASAWVVADDAKIVDASARRLFLKASPTDTDEALVRDELAFLHARLFGELVTPDSTEVGESFALFSSLLAASGDPKRAFQGVLTAMLQDVRVVTY
ncbi:MAG: DUF1585 domain-containing protein [Polyangiaceae bacterium]